MSLRDVAVDAGGRWEAGWRRGGEATGLLKMTLMRLGRMLGLRLLVPSWRGPLQLLSLLVVSLALLRIRLKCWGAVGWVLLLMLSWDPLRCAVSRILLLLRVCVGGRLLRPSCLRWELAVRWRGGERRLLRVMLLLLRGRRIGVVVRWPSSWRRRRLLRIALVLSRTWLGVGHSLLRSKADDLTVSVLSMRLPKKKRRLDKRWWGGGCAI